MSADAFGRAPEEARVVDASASALPMVDDDRDAARGRSRALLRRIDRAAFGAWKRIYWQHRARDFGGG